MYGWTNEAGEPIMDGAAYRFEQELDAQSAAERFEEDFYSMEGDEPDWCKRCGEEGHEADECEDVAPEYDDENTEPWEDEDGWLDGSYEE